MSDMHDNQAFAMSSQASPGELLHHEREAIGLSLEEAATGLNLRPAVVRGLENDDYAEVPVAAYRRGYLRAYARLLGIDDAPVIHAYNLRFGETETVQRVEPAQVSRSPSRLSSGWLIRLAGLLIVLGLGVLVVLWWQGRDRAPIEPIDANEPIAVDSLDGTTIISGEPAPDDNASLPATPSGLESSTDTASSAPANESTAAANGGSSAANSDENGGAPEQSEVASASENAQDGSSPAAALPAATPNDPVLAFTFNKESWTEVVDATGKRIFVGLQSPNTQAKVEGEPPYRLTVGNANGVELRFRGETVDLARIAGAGNVARFTLGE